MTGIHVSAQSAEVDDCLQQNFVGSTSNDKGTSANCDNDSDGNSSDGISSSSDDSLSDTETAGADDDDRTVAGTQEL